MLELHEDEKILYEARKHWFVISKAGTFVGVLMLAPIILVILLFSFFPELLAIFSEPKFIAASSFFAASWLVILWVIFFVAWTDYYLDVLIITDRRLIDVEQIGLFRRDIASMPLSNIQDITVEVAGVTRTLLKFGDIQVQTAGQTKELLVHDVANPEEVKQLIMSAYSADKARMYPGLKP
ncbi:MAG: PH domain-containing protein [Candidatus Colwellbacteria bacterium]|nr:PH domain-containing protein [Candidatus Colwellbacteria bacterium]